MVDSGKHDKEVLRWREKYFTLSEEQDKAEQDFASYLKVLQRALVRISLAADGQDKELDKHLGALRNMLRKEPVDQGKISNHLELIETAILQLDKQRKDTGSQGLDTLLQLVEQLSQLNLPRDKQKALKQYAKSLRAQDDQLSAYPALLSEYSRLQSAALADAFQGQKIGEEATSEAVSGGFLSRLFGAKNEEGKPIVGGTPAATEIPSADQEQGVSQTDDSSVPSDASPHVEEPLGEGPAEAVVAVRSTDSGNQAVEQEEAKEVLSEVGHLSAASATDGTQAQADDFEAVIKVLADLLEQLPLTPEIRAEAEQLRDQLIESAEVSELERMVDGTAELVLAALGKSQQEFEQFLLALDGQLAEINQYLGAQGQSGAGRKDASEQLSLAVRNQVNDISKVMGDAADLSSLKSSVQQQLNSIVGSMDNFVETESQREQALEQELQNMRDKLEVLQHEAQAVRNKLHNETLRALTDTLTHIPNREAFDERFSLERERYLRYKHPASLAILDIDHFKQVNDNHGHLVGDRVLQEVARTIKKMIRKTDFVARYGGEEFVLIMPETSLEPAGLALEKIRGAVAAMPLKAIGSVGAVTVSAGLAAFQLGERAEELVERADKALYKAKQRGRDRVEIAE